MRSRLKTDNLGQHGRQWMNWVEGRVLRALNSKLPAKNLFGKPPKVTDEPIAKIICNQLDIKQGHVTREELDLVPRKIKNWKAAGLDEISTEVWKTRKFDDKLLRYCSTRYDENTIDRWTKRCILPFLKKGDLGIVKNYGTVTLTSLTFGGARGVIVIVLEVPVV